MNANRNLVRNWQDDAALERFQMIAPLLDEDLDPAKRIQLRRQTAEQNGLSEKTISRYEKAFREGGFEGLKPQSGGSRNRNVLPENFDELVEEAKQLRREVPSRSVEKVITILEMEGRVAPGVLKRSTMQRHLFDAGFGAAHLQTASDARKSSSKRFCKPHRMMLVQGDVKYGPVLPPAKKGGKKIQTYLSSAIDDHSRMILFSRFYDNQEETVIADTMRNAILRHGRFDACYFDNGKQYVAKQLKLSLAKLSIRIRHAPPESGKSKGKIEKFHQTVDFFLEEAKVKKLRTLEDLNRYWEIFLEEYYQKKPHDGIREYYESLKTPVPEKGITPLQEWNRDSRSLVYLDAGVVAEAFLHHEKRKVDKGGCISFQGRKYETKTSLIGFTVEIAYDPMAPETVTVHYPGIVPFEARPLEIGAYCDPKPALPASMQPVEPETSRFLDALEKRYSESMQHRADAISFSSYGKEVSANGNV